MANRKRISWQEQALPQKAKNTLFQFNPHHFKDFYMAGGTALALMLGHRISLDFYFFTSNKKLLEKNERHSFITLLKNNESFQVLEEKEGTLHLNIHGILFSFFYYPYPLLRSSWVWHHIKIADIEDISSMKLSAILGRGTRKDFIDLYFICQKIGFENILKISKKKFPDHPNFQIQVLKAMTYFEDAEKDPTPKMLIPLEWKTIKAYFKKHTQDFLTHQFI